MKKEKMARKIKYHPKIKDPPINAANPVKTMVAVTGYFYLKKQQYIETQIFNSQITFGCLILGSIAANSISPTSKF